MKAKNKNVYKQESYLMFGVAEGSANNTCNRKKIKEGQT